MINARVRALLMSFLTWFPCVEIEVKSFVLECKMRNEAGWFLRGTGFWANVYMIRVFMESVRTPYLSSRLWQDSPMNKRFGIFYFGVQQLVFKFKRK